MTPPEIAAMLESLYRVRGGAVEFRTLSLQPRPFLGTNGFQFDYEHLDSDELWRKGRAVGAVIDGKLYLILLDAARSHYYGDDPARFRNRSSLRPSCGVSRPARSVPGERRACPGDRAASGDVDVRADAARRLRAAARRRLSGLAGLGGGVTAIGALRGGLVCWHRLSPSSPERIAADQRLPRRCRLPPTILAIGRAPPCAARAWRNW